MLKLNLSYIATLRGTNKLFTFLKKNGFTHSTATSITSGNAKSISFKHLELLCNIFNCTPHDLLEWLPSTEQKDVANHPLQPLRKTLPANNIKELIQSLPLAQLNELTKIFNELKKP